ncbi:aspartyl aminopeptidase [Malassezia sp. CBS 17886]|nr:aspartyl aminopeptidase [Malassezia sp. CBS 17886]
MPPTVACGGAAHTDAAALRPERMEQGWAGEGGDSGGGAARGGDAARAEAPDQGVTPSAPRTHFAPAAPSLPVPADASAPGTAPHPPDAARAVHAAPASHAAVPKPSDVAEGARRKPSSHANRAKNVALSALAGGSIGVPGADTPAPGYLTAGGGGRKVLPELVLPFPLPSDTAKASEEEGTVPLEKSVVFLQALRQTRMMHMLQMLPPFSHRQRAGIEFFDGIPHALLHGIDPRRPHTLQPLGRADVRVGPLVYSGVRFWELGENTGAGAKGKKGARPGVGSALTPGRGSVVYPPPPPEPAAARAAAPAAAAARPEPVGSAAAPANGAGGGAPANAAPQERAPPPEPSPAQAAPPLDPGFLVRLQHRAEHDPHLSALLHRARLGQLSHTELPQLNAIIASLMQMPSTVHRGPPTPLAPPRGPPVVLVEFPENASINFVLPLWQAVVERRQGLGSGVALRRSVLISMFLPAVGSKAGPERGGTRDVVLREEHNARRDAKPKSKPARKATPPPTPAPAHAVAFPVTWRIDADAGIDERLWNCLGRVPGCVTTCGGEGGGLDGAVYERTDTEPVASRSGAQGPTGTQPRDADTTTTRQPPRGPPLPPNGASSSFASAHDARVHSRLRRLFQRKLAAVPRAHALPDWVAPSQVPAGLEDHVRDRYAMRTVSTTSRPQPKRKVAAVSDRDVVLGMPGETPMRMHDAQRADSPPTKRKRHVATHNPDGSIKSCGACGKTKTPMWRRGPKGPSQLCNACGARWKAGRLVVPDEAPAPILDDTLPTVVQLCAGPPVPSAALRFLKYVEASPSPFHAVATSVGLLEKAGFVKLREQDAWEKSVEPGGKYFYTRNQSSLVAFAVGRQFRAGGAVHMVGAHTDSPNLRVRPVSKRSKEGYLQCSVETYGGGLWATWFDRDLSLAGRVIVAASDAQTSFRTRLVHVGRPLMRIPTLAIHLNRTQNDAFTFNQEDNMQPVLGLADALNDCAGEAGSTPAAQRHHPALLGLLAQELGCPVDHIHDFELCLYDTQAPTAGGIANEFLFTPRVDNEISCFCATEALLASLADPAALDGADAIRAVALFDNEEFGSVSYQGAESSLLWTLVHRLAALHPDAAEQTLAKSFLISSDTAHAVHPNYAGVHEDHLRPKLNAGPVVKTNAKQRYASTAVTTFLMRRVAERAGVPLQEFEVRNDCACGSTIGPMLSKHVRTVDIGNPQLSMHSIREMCGSQDVEYKVRLLTEFFRAFGDVDQELEAE